MLLPILLIIFGSLALNKGEFKVTRNLRVSGSASRVLGGILLAGGVLSFIHGAFGLIALAMVIIIGLGKAERVDPSVGPVTKRDFKIRVGLGIVLIALLVGCLTIFLALIGPSVDRAFQRITDNYVAPTLVVKPASDINIDIEDLDNSFILEMEDTQVDDSMIMDRSERLFTSQNTTLLSLVVVYREFLPDTISDLRDGVPEWVQKSFGSPNLVFDLSQDIELGDFGVMQRFFTSGVQDEGYVLSCVRKNVVVFMIEYKPQQKVSPDELHALARIIEGRIP